MKTRQGFVSNSSSSSFIVAWDKKPETSEEIKKILFNNYNNVNGVWNDDKYDTLKLSQIILEDTVEVSEKTIKEEFRNSISLYDGKWYEKPYKGDKKLMDKVIEEDRITSIEMEKLDEILKVFTYEERNIIRKKIERQKKLSRINKENIPNLTERELLFFDTNKKYEKINNRHWNNKYMKKLIDASYKSFIEDNKGKFITTYEYSDNDGNIDSHLEHSGTFDNLTHIKISNH